MSELDPKSIRLTETVKKGGCAAKLPAGQLKNILQKLNIKKLPELSVGTENMDDACLWDLKDLGTGLSLVQTLDFFTPIVDDAFDFGSIAAANALSDVYAMGGYPKIALSILAFPTHHLPLEILSSLMGGAIEKIEEAGACLAGGHTIDDDTLKFGLSVTGFVETKNTWKNMGAKPGDVLILTKGIGTGTLTTALKNRELKEEYFAPLIASMKQLNNAPELLNGIKVNAATDITGFGLAGHLLQMARASGVQIILNVDDVPLLPGTLWSLGEENLNRAHGTNFDYVKNDLNTENLSAIHQGILTDPQTSGGLLLVIPEQLAKAAVEKLIGRFQQTKIIGKITTINPGLTTLQVG